jgi:hypothetical protein
MQFGKTLGPETPHYKHYRRAVRRFPDVQSCIADSQRAREQPDLTKFDWSKFENSKFAEVCLFRIATSYQSAQAFESWLGNQGFSVGSGYILGYRSDRNYPNSLDFQVYGRWDVNKQGALIYADKKKKDEIERYIRSYTVTLEIRVDVGILQISAGYDSP